jgi:hypothetical protein
MCPLHAGNHSQHTFDWNRKIGKVNVLMPAKTGAGTDFLSVLGCLGWDRRFWVRVVEFVAIWAIWHF